MAMPSLWDRLLQDPNFSNDVKCQYASLRNTLLTSSFIFSFLNKYALDTLVQAQARHFSRWKILGTNPGGFNAYIVPSYTAEIQTLKTWILGRLSWMDANMGTGTCSGIVATLGENSLTPPRGLEIYPNPFVVGFSIASSSIIYSLEVYDAQGKKVYSKEEINASRTTLESGMEELVQGVYGIKCVTNTGTQMKWVYKGL
jgi:hypothetical protein